MESRQDIDELQSLTEMEERRLWESGELGDATPIVLLHTIWYLCTVHSVGAMKTKGGIKTINGCEGKSK